MENQECLLTNFDTQVSDSILSSPKISLKSKFFPSADKEKTIISTSSCFQLSPKEPEKRSASSDKETNSLFKVNRWVILKHGLRAVGEMRKILCTKIISPVAQ